MPKGKRGTPPFVALGLQVCEKMNMYDKDSQRIVMKFCKMYEPEKIIRITKYAMKYPWWERNKKAAFMKAVGEINKIEKQREPESESDVKKKIDKIMKWLSKNKKHEKFKEGIEVTSQLIKDNNLIEWFNEQKYDFKMSMEIINHKSSYENAKKIFKG